MVWEVLRTVVVGETFSQYGVNPYFYFGIVMIIAIPYAKSTVKLVTATVFERWKKVWLFAPIVLVLHFVPDLFILLAATSLPPILLDSFLLMILLFFFIGVRAFMSKVKVGRQPH